MDESVVVPLESFAMVHAGLEAGASLERSLANAGVDPSQWDAASAHWDPLLDGASADRAQVSAYERALRAAREKYEPTAEPIASDADAWVAFRAHFLAADDPAEFLRSRSLELSLYGKLEGAWSDRAEADEALAAKLRAGAGEPLPACPEIHLVRSPLCPEEAPPPVARPAPVPPKAADLERPVEKPSYLLAEQMQAGPDTQDAPGPDTLDSPAIAEKSATPFRPPSVRPARLDSPPPRPPVVAPAPIEEPPPIAIERYAVMFADKHLFGISEAELAQKHGMSVAELAHALSYWATHAARDAQVAIRVDRLVERYRAALQKVRGSGSSGAIRAVQPPPPATTATLDPKAVDNGATRGPESTQPTGDLVKAVRAALPFRNANLPVPAHLYANIAAATGSRSPASRPSTGTLFAPSGGGGAALPFEDMSPIEGCTMESYAQLAAELSVKPQDRQEVFAQYGVRDDEHYRSIANGWNRRVVDFNLSGKYMQLFASHLDAVKQRR